MCCISSKLILFHLTCRYENARHISLNIVTCSLTAHQSNCNGIYFKEFLKLSFQELVRRPPQRVLASQNVLVIHAVYYGRSWQTAIETWQLAIKPHPITERELETINMAMMNSPDFRYTTLRVPAPPYAAILLCDQIILNRDVILHCTIPKPYIHWKAMLLSRHHCRSFAAACNLRHLAAY